MASSPLPMKGKMLTDSPTVDSLRLADALKRRMPRQFASYIELAMWEAVGDFWAIGGGHFRADGSLHILAPLPAIYAICPERELGLLC